MVHGIEDEENEATRDDIDFEVSRVSTLCRVQPRGAGDPNTSGEYIHITNISMWSETSVMRMGNSHTRVNVEELFHLPDTSKQALPVSGDGEAEIQDREDSDEQHSEHAFMLSRNFSQVCTFQAVNQLA
jgi:hypothetical protein